ncbi:DUF5753 domain-containing protein [Frankia sp. Ag45/Mut15]|uniref:DUF5753 domain-containing protein n=1 Tax=Frankia umida TaxID=573489 RepID=A0ABT0JZI2_9ACTN|nr:Scr1 family TA system antitoxin-like transcriptional regulator [Frankia umida]MCK9876964.1 DUF5753 domain-containing protein [Frankia umida]
MTIQPARHGPRTAGKHAGHRPNRGSEAPQEAAAQPNVTIQVLPFAVGGHAALGTSFTHLGFPDPDDPEVVYVEVLTGSLYVEKPEEVRQYRDKLDHLRALALTPHDSTEMITSVAREQP